MAASATGLFRLALTELRVAEVRAGPDALRLDFSADRRSADGCQPLFGSRSAAF